MARSKYNQAIQMLAEYYNKAAADMMQEDDTVTRANRNEMVSMMLDEDATEIADKILKRVERMTLKRPT